MVTRQDGDLRPGAEDAVLAILRSCCAEAEIQRYAAILIHAPAIASGVGLGGSFRDVVLDAIADAVDSLPSAERQAVRIMAGLERGWEPSKLITREARKAKMGMLLVRSEDVAAGGLSGRRVEQMEKGELGPAVTALLFKPKHKRKIALRDRPIFAQFINPEFLGLHNQRNLLSRPEAIRSRLDYVTRMALFASRVGLVLPASYLFEVPGVVEFMADTHELAELGAIQFTAPASSLGEYQAVKTLEYRDDPRNPYVSEPPHGLEHLPWRPRHGGSAGRSIIEEWSQEVRPGAALAPVVEAIARSQNLTYRAAARTLSAVPERLEGRALVARFVVEAIKSPIPPAGRYAVEWLLSNKYLESYLNDLDAAILVDFPFGSFAPTAGAHDLREISATRMERVLKLLGIGETVLHAAPDWQMLLSLRDAFALDVLLPALYEDNSSDGRWLKAAAFRERSAAPPVERDLTGYLSWLGDLLVAVT